MMMKDDGMRLLNTVIYTNKLPEVRAFYGKHFAFPADTGYPNAYGIFPFAEAKITFVDAASAGVVPSQGMLLRLGLPFPNLERARIIAEGGGSAVGDLVTEDWGSYYGQSVQYFTLTDPSGTRVQFFEDHFGEDRQLMTTGDGTGTKKVQEQNQS